MNIMGKHIYYRDILAFNLSEPLLAAFLSFSLFPLHLCLLSEGHVVLFKLFPCVLRNKSRQTAHLQYSTVQKYISKVTNQTGFQLLQIFAFFV